MSETPEDRLARLGLSLPPVPQPVAEYLPAKVSGDLIYVSGQGPFIDGRPLYVGAVGAEVSSEQAHHAAQLCALNCLAAIRGEVGSLQRVEEILTVRVFVNSSVGFYDQPRVANGASRLLVEVFGVKGRHARAAIGTSSLPFNIPVEVEMVARIAVHAGGPPAQ